MKKVITKPATVQYQRRLSPLRVILATLILIGTVYGAFIGLRQWRQTQAVVTQEPWFAAYVDVTSTPTYAFEQLGSTSTPNVVLSFIVSSPSDPCTPSWGTAYGLDEANSALDLDRRIARLQQQGGKIAVSFGGALNDELALNCQDLDGLVQGYQAVIDRYGLNTIDLDLENEGLTNIQAAKRRAQAIAKLQAKRRSQGKSLAVWLTLPVAPQGLTQEGIDVIALMLDNGVDLAGVNVMTMNYGASRLPGQSMLKASENALSQTHRQLGVLYQQAGLNLTGTTIWRKLGATPMIGQNDLVGEVFTPDDAQGLNTFANDHGIGRLSMWSANRDVPCGDNYVNVQVVSDSCSGVTANPLEFSQLLSQGLDGDLTQNSTIVTTNDPAAQIQPLDDSETSPYQIWKDTGAYLAGTKVVWHRNVYEAKWWTKGDLPDNPVLQSWETPWQLVGPVLPGEKPLPQPTLPPGTYPIWAGATVYEAGNRVLFDGIPFQAKWWNQGQSPAASAANADNSPWISLTNQEIEQLLEGTVSP